MSTMLETLQFVADKIHEYTQVKVYTGLVCDVDTEDFKDSVFIFCGLSDSSYEPACQHSLYIKRNFDIAILERVDTRSMEQHCVLVEKVGSILGAMERIQINDTTMSRSKLKSFEVPSKEAFSKTDWYVSHFNIEFSYISAYENIT